jgi:hypothetical protein
LLLRLVAALDVFVLGTALALRLTHKLRVEITLFSPQGDTRCGLKAVADVICDGLCCPVAVVVMLFAEDESTRAWWAVTLPSGPSLALALASDWTLEVTGAAATAAARNVERSAGELMD